MGTSRPPKFALRLWNWLAPPDAPSPPRRAEAPFSHQPSFGYETGRMDCRSTAFQRRRFADERRTRGSVPDAPSFPPLWWSGVQGVRSPGWTDIVGSALLVLAVAVPTMIIEEDWHGRPMIDQSTHLWIIAACLVAGAFFIGGAVVAFRRPSAPDAVRRRHRGRRRGDLVAGGALPSDLDGTRAHLAARAASLDPGRDGRPRHEPGGIRPRSSV